MVRGVHRKSLGRGYLIICAALTASCASAPSRPTPPATCQTKTGGAAPWKVDKEATTENLTYRPEGYFVLFEPEANGCWRVEEISYARISRSRPNQELLVLSPAKRTAVVAFEISGQSAWCYDDASKNDAAYGPCRSALVEPRTDLRWLGNILNAGKTGGGDRHVGVSESKVIEVLNSVPTLDETLKVGIEHAIVQHKADAAKQVEDERDAAFREQTASRERREKRAAQQTTEQSARLKDQPASTSGPQVDAAGRRLIRGPIESTGGKLQAVHIVSGTIGVVHRGPGPLTIEDSVISAPVCVSTPGMVGLALLNNTLDCDLGVQYETSIVIGTTFINNRVRGEME